MCISIRLPLEYCVYRPIDIDTEHHAHKQVKDTNNDGALRMSFEYLFEIAGEKTSTHQL